MSSRSLCLLVDDDPEFIEFAKACLTRTSPKLETRSFLSSMDAYRFLLSNPVDLIVTDFRMPILDGLQLTNQVRQGDSTVPILVVSGDRIESEALTAGATKFLHKGDFRSHIGDVLAELGVTSVHDTRAAENTPGAGTGKA